MDLITWGSFQKDKGGSGFYSAVGACCFSEVGLVTPIDSCFPFAIKGTRITPIPEPIPEKFRKPKVLHLATADPVYQFKMFEEFSPRRFTSMDTHKTWVTQKKDSLKVMQDNIDILFLDCDEACHLSGKEDATKAARALVNGSSVVIKMGAKGCIIADGTEVWKLPAYPTKAFDLSGVGDMFAGAFMSYLNKRPSLVKAGAYATVVASLGIERDGVKKLVNGDRKIVNRRYKEYLKSLNSE